jgi:eukaryotic-like serine/threonine-protein kinase
MKLMRDLVGETLSHRYRLVSRIAGGGMGDVYRGHDLLLDRRVAVKVLQPSLAADQELVARFRMEARAAARLSHPNIVAVFDWGSDDEQTYYMVMEYVAGTDLRDLLVGSGVLHPAQAAEIMAAVCEALAAAHVHGVVHRDVKPENVLIARDGTVKVADFGIAAVADYERTVPGGTITGTLRYLSPEQARGEEATLASDVWGAGAVLSELLTGKPPLQGAGDDLLRRRAEEPPIAPSSYDPTLPETMDEIVLKACALDPAERFSTAGEMAHSLRRASWRSLPDAPSLDSLLTDVTGEIRLPDLEPTSFEGRNGHKKKRARKFKPIRLALVLAIVAALIFGAWKGVSAFLAPQMVDVPGIQGMSLSEARDAAQEWDLKVEVTKRRPHLKIEQGAVIKQTPARGTLEEGSTINVILSTGLPTYDVPEVLGLDLPKAKAAIAKTKLKVGEISERYDDAEPGTVVSQDPLSGGKLEHGEEIALVVSMGPRPVTIPDVSELTSEEAVDALERAGFSVSVTEEYSDDIDEGVVIGTTPAPGEEVLPESEVTVVVSAGPEFEKMKMPDVRGMSSASAKSQLSGMGLSPRVMVVDGCAGDTVQETSPLQGATVQEGQSVTLYVC